MRRTATAWPFPLLPVAICTGAPIMRNRSVLTRAVAGGLVSAAGAMGARTAILISGQLRSVYET